MSSIRLVIMLVKVSERTPHAGVAHKITSILFTRHRKNATDQDFKAELYAHLGIGEVSSMSGHKAELNLFSVMQEYSSKGLVPSQSPGSGETQISCMCCCICGSVNWIAWLFAVKESIILSLLTHPTWILLLENVFTCWELISVRHCLFRWTGPCCCLFFAGLMLKYFKHYS